MKAEGSRSLDLILSDIDRLRSQVEAADLDALVDRVEVLEESMSVVQTKVTQLLTAVCALIDAINAATIEAECVGSNITVDLTINPPAKPATCEA